MNGQSIAQRAKVLANEVEKVMFMFPPPDKRSKPENWALQDLRSAKRHLDIVVDDKTKKK